MKISPINNTDYRHKPSYKGITRSVYENVTLENGVHLKHILRHMNNSWMLRPQSEICLKHYNYFSQVFPGTDKVNIYDYGCSLGYSVYGWILWLLSGTEKHPERFFPLIAKDYDVDVIEAAKEGLLPLSEAEIGTISAVIKKETIDDFFDVDYSKYGGIILGTEFKGYLARPTKKLTDNVQFSVADIRDDYKNIEPERSIVVATNIWPYIKQKEERYGLIENLYRHLNKGSYVKIGDGFDNNRILLRDKKSTADIFLGVGFKRTEEFENIFKK